MKSNKFSYAFLLVSLIIASSDMLLIGINYVSAKQALERNIETKGEQLEESFNIALKQVEGFMRQTATYIATDKRVRELFWQGRQAVEREGGGAGGEQAQALRLQLYMVVASGWEEMTRYYDGLQLHFHLPPDISFLRVHRPDRFGDDITDVRHTINFVNQQRQPVVGFELGRVFSGVRGAVPVFYQPDDDDDDDDEQSAEYVGVLEAGTSFAHMLRQLKLVLSSDFSIWLAEQHARQVMWPEVVTAYLTEHPSVDDFLLEAATDKAAALALADKPEVKAMFAHSGTRLVDSGTGPLAVTRFALFDYLGEQDKSRGAVGSVLVWTSAATEVAAFRSSVTESIVTGVIGFLLIEILIYFGIRIGRKTEHQLYQQEMMTVTDGLTGLTNRRGFDSAFEKEFYRAVRSGSALSVAFCDVDYFKQYNDHYGHLIGDDCLKNVANCLVDKVRRSGDLVARYGGEEFVLILPGMEREEALRFMESLRCAVESLQIPHAKSAVSPWVTMSCGLATQIGGSRHHLPEVLLDLADQALYTAKRSGRNQTHVEVEPLPFGVLAD